MPVPWRCPSYRRRSDETTRGRRSGSEKTTIGQEYGGATRERDGGATRGKDATTSWHDEATRGRHREKTTRGQDGSKTRGDAQVAQREDKSAAQCGDNHGKTPLDNELDRLLERYVHPSSPSPTLYSFSSPLLPVNAVSSQFCFSWQPKRFAPSASASRHALLHRKCLLESLGMTCGSSSIGLEALCPQSHCEHHLQDVVLLDDRSNGDILVSCGMSEDRTSCAVRRHGCRSQPALSIHQHSS